MGKSRGMNERIQKLRDISVNTPVHIDLERAKIETDFYKEYRRQRQMCIRDRKHEREDPFQNDAGVA